LSSLITGAVISTRGWGSRRTLGGVTTSKQTTKVEAGATATLTLVSSKKTTEVESASRASTKISGRQGETWELAVATKKTS
jgi:hypothetical protein